MFEIEVYDYFYAAHALKLYDGNYEKLHWHRWKVSVLFRSQGLDSIGVVTDFEALKLCLKKVLEEFHEISINGHPDFGDGRLNPSTENITMLIFDRLNAAFKSKNAKLVKVTVWETPEASASYVA